VGGPIRAKGGARDKQMHGWSAWAWNIGPMQVWGLSGGTRPGGSGGCMARGSIG